jgi:hypothetical protein
MFGTAAFMPVHEMVVKIESYVKCLHTQVWRRRECRAYFLVG